MRRVVCPGSFDPVTNGHLDVIGRAAALLRRGHRRRARSTRRKAALFTRRRAPRDARARPPPSCANVRRRLLARACSSTSAATDGIPAIVKGLRAVSDFDYELQMAQMNHRLAGVETLFVPTNPAYSYLSSSLVKEVATHGGDVDGSGPRRRDRQLIERLAPRSPAPTDRPPTVARRPTSGDARPWTSTTSSTSSPPSSRAPARCRCRPSCIVNRARCSALLDELRAAAARGDRPGRAAPRRPRAASSSRPRPRPTQIIAAAHEERMRLVSADRGLRPGPARGRAGSAPRRARRPAACATRSTRTSTASWRPSRSRSTRPSSAVVTRPRAGCAAEDELDDPASTSAPCPAPEPGRSAVWAGHRRSALPWARRSRPRP